MKDTRVQLEPEYDLFIDYSANITIRSWCDVFISALSTFAIEISHFKIAFLPHFGLPLFINVSVICPIANWIQFLCFPFPFRKCNRIKLSNNHGMPKIRNQILSHMWHALKKTTSYFIYLSLKPVLSSPFQKLFVNKCTARMHNDVDPPETTRRLNPLAIQFSDVDYADTVSNIRCTHTHAPYSIHVELT